MDGGGLVKIESKTGQTIATSHPKGSFFGREIPYFRKIQVAEILSKEV